MKPQNPEYIAKYAMPSLPTRMPSTKQFIEAERKVEYVTYLKNKKKEGK